MEDIRLENLLNKYKEGTCSTSERDELLQWLSHYNEDQTEIQPEAIEQLGQEIRQELLKLKGNSTDFKLWEILSAVATFTLIAFTTFFYFKPSTAPVKSVNVTDILPGGNRATLTLANGKTINLDTAKSGIKISNAGIYYDDGTVIINNTSDNANQLATINTPKGGEYHIILSDGTKVWLNAASTLQYPAVFRERIARNVKLICGEAYFEVFKDKKRPFVVSTGQQDVLVLGTHFNINAYKVDSIRTTLLEGSVKVISKSNLQKPTLLKPGEQATYSIENVMVKTVDLDLETAWKNGNTEFQDADLKTIMTMLERWYNIEVTYQGSPITTRFTGSVSRSRNISEVLKFLESTGNIHFKIEGRKVLIMR